MDRREFFGAAAATSVAAALPTRQFVRTLDDRTSDEHAKYLDNVGLIFRFYNGNKLVRKCTRFVPVIKKKNVTHIGIGCHEIFTFDRTVNITRLTVSLPVLPEHETELVLPLNYYSLAPGNTLTLDAAAEGYLAIS